MPRGHVARPPWCVTRPAVSSSEVTVNSVEREHRAAPVDGRLELLGGEVEEVHRGVDAVAAHRSLGHEQVEHVEADPGAGPLERGVRREARLTTLALRAAAYGSRTIVARGRVLSHPGEVGVGAHDEDQVLGLEARVHEGGHEEVVVAQPHVDQRCHHGKRAPAYRPCAGPSRRERHPMPRRARRTLGADGHAHPARPGPRARAVPTAPVPAAAAGPRRRPRRPGATPTVTATVGGHRNGECLAANQVVPAASTP